MTLVTTRAWSPRTSLYAVATAPPATAVGDSVTLLTRRSSRYLMKPCNVFGANNVPALPSFGQTYVQPGSGGLGANRYVQLQVCVIYADLSCCSCVSDLSYALSTHFAFVVANPFSRLVIHSLTYAPAIACRLAPFLMWLSGQSPFTTASPSICFPEGIPACLRSASRRNVIVCAVCAQIGHH